ncbi:MAG: helix-turn-helix domain-containing protein [Clostridia bacterium]|nr:helix-turn-helix domain-containing protein [Clostridia bacterium]
MTLIIGENLKKLRIEKDLTQEELAAFLGVTFQTVSKWERNENYPDITLLPAIASFFGVSVDELLGTEREKQESKILEYLELFEKMRLKDYSEGYAVFSRAIREFPGDFRLLVRYMELLSTEKDSIRAPDYEDTNAEIRQIYDQIQTRCMDDNIRIWAKRVMIRHLVKRFECVGDKNARAQADAILASLPELHDGREYLTMTMNSDPDTHFDLCESAIQELTLLLANSLARAYYYNSGVPTIKKIEIVESFNKMLLSVFPDALFTKNGIHLIYNYGRLGYMYCEIGDEESALKYLSLAAESAVLLDSRQDVSEIIAREYEQEPVYREMNMRKRMKTLMIEHYPLSDPFKEKPEFLEILAKMK